jgi:hypothetical protein
MCTRSYSGQDSGLHWNRLSAMQSLFFLRNQWVWTPENLDSICQIYWFSRDHFTTAVNFTSLKKCWKYDFELITSAFIYLAVNSNCSFNTKPWQYGRVCNSVKWKKFKKYKVFTPRTINYIYISLTPILRKVWVINSYQIMR